MKKKFILLPITLTALAPAISLVGCGGDTPEPKPTDCDFVIDTYGETLGDSSSPGIYSSKPVLLEPNHKYTFLIDFKNYIPPFTWNWIFFTTKDKSEGGYTDFLSEEKNEFLVNNKDKLIQGSSSGCDGDYFFTAADNFEFNSSDSEKIQNLTKNDWISGFFTTDEDVPDDYLAYIVLA